MGHPSEYPCQQSIRVLWLIYDSRLAPEQRGLMQGRILLHGHRGDVAGQHRPAQLSRIKKRSQGPLIRAIRPVVNLRPEFIRTRAGQGSTLPLGGMVLVQVRLTVRPSFYHLPIFFAGGSLGLRELLQQST